MVRVTPRGQVAINKVLYKPGQVYELDNEFYEKYKSDFKVVEVVKKKELKNASNKMLKSEKTK